MCISFNTWPVEERLMNTAEFYTETDQKFPIPNHLKGLVWQTLYSNIINKT